MSDYRTLTVPEDTHREFKIEAAKRCLPMTEAADQAIRQWIKSKPAPEKKKELQPA